MSDVTWRSVSNFSGYRRKAFSRCPSCGRILLPTRGLWPAHINPASRKFCAFSDKPWPK